MIEIEVAKPLTMLSAYFMTAAMTRPPNADKHMIKTANSLIPCSHPFSAMAFASTKATFKSAKIMPKKPLF